MKDIPDTIPREIIDEVFYIESTYPDLCVVTSPSTLFIYDKTCTCEDYLCYKHKWVYIVGVDDVDKSFYVGYHCSSSSYVNAYSTTNVYGLKRRVFSILDDLYGES